MILAEPTQPTKYVLKVYDTENKADLGKDSEALYVISSTDPTVDNSTKINDVYTINRKYYYRVETNEPVNGIEIDWDDGEDNSDEKGNRELKTFTSPKTIAVFEHYYTKHSSFYPLIRVKSNREIYSKWYTPFHINNNYRKLEENILPAGNNNNSTISIDSSTNPHIPIFKPANLSPLAILKADKNKIYSGIDNAMLSGMRKAWVIAYYPTTTFEPADIIITYENGLGQIGIQTITPWTDHASKGAGIISTYGPTAYDTVPAGITDPAANILATAPHLKVKRILRVELKNNLKGTDDKGLSSYSDRVFIKVFDRATLLSTEGGGSAGTENANDPAVTSETMAMVSLGNPIVEIDDYMSTLNVDGSESRTRASNRTLSTFYFDNDKLSQSSTDWEIGAPNDAATQLGETFSSAVGILQRGYVSITGTTSAEGTSSTYRTITCENIADTGIDSYPDDYFNGMRITFLGDTTSTLANKWTTVRDYASATGVITLEAPHASFSVPAANGFVISNLSGEISDELTSSLSNGDVSQKKLSYTFKYGEALLDDDGRYYEDNKLIRLQVQDDSTATDGDKISKSKLEHWQPYKYNTEVARSFSVKHDSTLAANASVSEETLTFAATKTDSRNIGKYIGVEVSTAYLKGLSLGGHPYNNKWIPGSDPIDTDTDTATDSFMYGWNYEIMKIKASDAVFPTLGDEYEVDRGEYNTRARGIPVGAKVFFLDTNSYNTRNIPSSEASRSLLLFTNSSGKPKHNATSLNEGSTNWRDCSVKNNLDNRIIFGGNGQHHTDGAPALGLVDMDPNEQESENFLLLAKNEKFDRIHFRMKNTLTTHASTSVKPTTGSAGSGPDIKIVAYYVAPQTAGSSTYVWKPLKIIDGTTIDNMEWSSLYNSGTVSFDIPNDWVKTTAEGMYGGSEWSDLVDRQNLFYDYGFTWNTGTNTDWDIGTLSVASGTEFGIGGAASPTDVPAKLALYEDDFFYGWQLDINDSAFAPKYIKASYENAVAFGGKTIRLLSDGQVGYTKADTDNFTLSNVNEVSPLQNWEFDGYGILIGIVCGNDVTPSNIKCQNVWTYNNSHSKSVKVVDPHHVSLNDIAIAQSISFGRKTRFRKLESRLGLADIEKIGAEGGSITFGGVDLGSASTGFNLIKSYQQKATPVFLDINHKNNEITRFFGIITNLTEDHPTGLATPKYGVTMELNYIIEMDANGLIISDGRIPLGGKATNELKYSLHT